MNNKGFTLIELLGVITLLGILLVITIPAMTKYSGKARNQAYETMSKSLYEGAASRYIDDGYMLRSCKLGSGGDNLEKLKKKFKNQGADHCEPVKYDANVDLVSGGYVEPIMAPDKSGKSCDGEVQIIKINDFSNNSTNQAEEYFYRVELKCPGREMVTVYTTTDSDGDD